MKHKLGLFVCLFVCLFVDFYRFCHGGIHHSSDALFGGRFGIQYRDAGDANFARLTWLQPLFWGFNPPNEGLFQSKQGSFGFQVYIYILAHLR